MFINVRRILSEWRTMNRSSATFIVYFSRREHENYQPAKQSLFYARQKRQFLWAIASLENIAFIFYLDKIEQYNNIMWIDVLFQQFFINSVIWFAKL